MQFTPENMEAIRHYVKKLYKSNYVLRSEPLEDILQEAYLIAIEINSTHIGSTLLFRHIMDKDKALYVFPKKFCELVPNLDEEARSDLIEQLKPLYNVFKRYIDKPVLTRLANDLYDKEEFRERFLDYMYGMSIGSCKARDMREKLFRNRFHILEVLADYGAIGESEFKYYMSLAYELKTPPKAKRKPLSTNKTAERCRRFYEKNKDEQRARLRKNYHKRKQQKAI